MGKPCRKSYNAFWRSVEHGMTLAALARFEQGPKSEADAPDREEWLFVHWMGNADRDKLIAEMQRRFTQETGQAL